MKKILFILLSFVSLIGRPQSYESAYRLLNQDTVKEVHSLSERQVENAGRMLERVRKIVIIDSISVGKEKVLEAFRLPRSAGRFLKPEMVTRLTGFKNQGMGTGFSNETVETVLWSEPDSLGRQRIVESVKLIDGNWSEPMWASLVLNGSTEEEDSLNMANAAYPFLLDNGLTLYYASDSEASIGGYDIFIATRDSSTGDYLMPQNVGMPFNSPYDDYLMAIDEQNGIGWWVTDRNQIPGKLTVYVYKLPEGRENIAEDEDPVPAARIDNYKANWTEENRKEIESLLQTVATLSADPFRENDFELQVPGGKHYRFWSDFKNPKAAEEMKKYVRQQKTLATKETELKKLRKDFSSDKNNTETAGKIISLEKETSQIKANLKKQLSDIYKLEFKNR